MDYETLSLTEIIRLREHLSEIVARRFERPLAIAFTDIVGSTAYFAQFGDEAGRGLHQRHLDLLTEIVQRGPGRVVETAGDGALTCFPRVEDAAAALIQLQQRIAAQNATRAPEHHLSVRCGLHWGPVLTDGVIVTGDAVNLCARVTATGDAREIRLTRPAALELPSRLRLRCRPLPAIALEGVPRPIEMVALQWRDVVPNVVRIAETAERFALPDKAVISFGRLREHGHAQANDIVLALPDKNELMRISRWHFELRRQDGALELHPLSDQGTDVDGRPVAKGGRAPVLDGTVVKLAGVMTLTFLAEAVGPLDDTEMPTVHRPEK